MQHPPSSTNVSNHDIKRISMMNIVGVLLDDNLSLKEHMP